MSHVPHPPSRRFLCTWFPHLGSGPKMAPPLWVSCYRCAPLGDSDATNMSHVPHPPSGRFRRTWFTHLGSGPKMAPPLWVSCYRCAPWGTVIPLTCHMFLIHLVEDFCALGFQTWDLGPRWHPLMCLGL